MEIRKPHRVSRTYTQHLCAPPEAVFPLLCPVREAEWLEHWDPIDVLTESGVAEPDCVFRTLAGGRETVWYLTRHEPDQGFVEFVRITPGLTACRLRIQLALAPGGSEARITYTHTSLGPDGDAFIHDFTEAHFQGFMQDWERRMNHFLASGTLLRG